MSNVAASWLWANKEWLFSGVGVALVAGAYAAFFRRTRRQLSTVSVKDSSLSGSPIATGSNISQNINFVIGGTTEQSPPDTTFGSKPTPVEIEAYLDSLPLYQRAEAQNSYRGLKVRWLVKLADLEKLSEGERMMRKTHATHRLMARFEKGGHGISAHVNVEQFSRLKISHDGTPMQISGTISRVSDLGSITLENVELRFLD